ncbi:hypothetical protein GQ53DRAFT_661752 [Thozetella sp. PMI_491]|nr:hypothetical protein GQ53DRAFT_661752 [Thozetella sp. PMI_491]
MNDITELPHDIFMLILWYLSPRTLVLCRRVGRRWNIAFTQDHLCKLLLRWNFPRCREVRYAAAAAAAAASASLASIAGLPRNLRVELEALAAAQTQDPGQVPWAAVFADVARRYYHMRTARPWVVEKLAMAREPFAFRGVQIWNRFLRLDDRTAHFHYPDPYWSYSQEDGVLVYPDEASSADPNGHVYRALDLATGTKTAVPFDVRGKYIRRVRLAQGVLVYEWAEAAPYHQLNIQEVVHRHFVTAFDLLRKLPAQIGKQPEDSPPPARSCEWTWEVQFRSEWKLHFLGLPINRSDRFFSAHTATHYAVYFWQPNRSLYQDDPIEQLAVWDISSPSPYHPSEDPTGDIRPHTDSAPPGPTGLWRGMNGGPSGASSGGNTTPARQSSPSRQHKSEEASGSAVAGPQVIRRMAWGELDFHGIRQGANPQLRNLALDDRNLYFIEEEHRWAEGQHSSLSPPRVHLVRCTGIPVIPPQAGPPVTPLVDEPVFGPMWVDTCGAEGDVNMNFCQRVALPRIQPRGQALHQSQSPADAQQPTPESGRGTHGTADVFPEALLPQPARWPGWAPCWRHEDFPYLTVTELVDLAAGVRIAARHCFMLETLSVHVRPKIWFRGPGEVKVGTGILRDSRGGELLRDMFAIWPEDDDGAGAGETIEAEFSDNLWGELLGRGHITGDERWVVGEDQSSCITVVRF